MNYLHSFKTNKDATPSHQWIKNEWDTLNLVRKAILKLQSMEETSADLRAIDFMNNVTPGHAMTIENPLNGHVVVIQVHNDDD